MFTTDRQCDWRWVAGTLAVILVAGCSREEAGETEQSTDAAADEVLRDMSARLGETDQFTFTAERHLGAGLLRGRDVAEDAQIEAWVKRPDKIRAVSRSNLGVRHFYFDGQRVTIYDETKNAYGVADISGNIDEMVDLLEERFGFTPPLAEFLVSDIYGDLNDQIQTLTLSGTTNVDGKECERLAFVGHLADGELTVSREDDLPCTLNATFRDLEGEPQVRIDFGTWNLDAELDDAMFTFVPPDDSRQIRMITEEEIEAWDAEQESRTNAGDTPERDSAAAAEAAQPQ